jgi:hypothetical protein
VAGFRFCDGANAQGHNVMKHTLLHREFGGHPTPRSRNTEFCLCDLTMKGDRGHGERLVAAFNKTADADEPLRRRVPENRVDKYLDLVAIGFEGHAPQVDRNGTAVKDSTS